MGVRENGGDVRVFGNDGKTRAVMAVSPKGGDVGVQGNDGEVRVSTDGERDHGASGNPYCWQALGDT